MSSLTKPEVRVENNSVYPKDQMKKVASLAQAMMHKAGYADKSFELIFKQGTEYGLIHQGIDLSHGGGSRDEFCFGALPASAGSGLEALFCLRTINGSVGSLDMYNVKQDIIKMLGKREFLFSDATTYQNELNPPVQKTMSEFLKEDEQNATILVRALRKRVDLENKTVTFRDIVDTLPEIGLVVGKHSAPAVGLLVRRGLLKKKEESVYYWTTNANDLLDLNDRVEGAVEVKKKRIAWSRSKTPRPVVKKMLVKKTPVKDRSQCTHFVGDRLIDLGKEEVTSNDIKKAYKAVAGSQAKSRQGLGGLIAGLIHHGYISRLGLGRYRMTKKDTGSVYSFVTKDLCDEVGGKIVSKADLYGYMARHIQNFAAKFKVNKRNYSGMIGNLVHLGVIKKIGTDSYLVSGASPDAPAAPKKVVRAKTGDLHAQRAEIMSEIERRSTEVTQLLQQLKTLDAKIAAEKPVADVRAIEERVRKEFLAKLA